MIKRKVGALLSVLICTLWLSVVPSQILAMSVTLAWDANIENDLAGYRVYWREHAAPTKNPPAWDHAYDLPLSLLEDVQSPQYVVPNVQEGTPTFFRVTAYDEELNESEMSQTVSLYAGQGADVAPAGNVTVRWTPEYAASLIEDQGTITLRYRLSAGYGSDDTRILYAKATGNTFELGPYWGNFTFRVAANWGSWAGVRMTGVPLLDTWHSVRITWDMQAQSLRMWVNTVEQTVVGGFAYLRSWADWGSELIQLGYSTGGTATIEIEDFEIFNTVILP